MSLPAMPFAELIGDIPQPPFAFKLNKAIIMQQRLTKSKGAAASRIRQLLADGREKLRSKDFGGAEKAFNEAYQAARDSGNLSFQIWALLFLAALTQGQGRYHEALQRVDEAIALDDSNDLAWWGKGELLYVHAKTPQEYEEVVRCYSRALNLHRDLANERDALYNLALVFHDLNRHDEAIDYFNKALQLAGEYPHPSSILLMKADSLSRLGRVEEAERAVKAAWPTRRRLKDKGKILYMMRLGLCAMQGLAALESSNMDEAERQARAYNLWKERAKKKGFSDIVEAFEKGLEAARATKPKEVEEFLELTMLVAIKDPFERWKVLGKMISAKWPEGLSAVDAIRELRE